MGDAASEKYRDWFERLTDSGRFKNDQEAKLTYRLFGWAELEDPFSEEVEHFWRMFLQYWPAGDPSEREGRVARPRASGRLLCETRRTFSVFLR